MTEYPNRSDPRVNAKTIVDRFVSSALVVPVSSVEPGRLAVPAHYAEKLEALHKSARECMRRLGAPLSSSGDLVDGLLADRLKHDLSYVSLDQNQAVILVKENLYSRLPEREIIERVHQEEVKSAAMRGEPVPEDLLRYYQSKPRHVSVATNPM